MYATEQVSGEDRTAMWNYVDANGDGHLNYFEFCAAFQVPSRPYLTQSVFRVVLQMSTLPQIRQLILYFH